MYKAIHIESKGSRLINEQGVVVFECGLYPTFEEHVEFLKVVNSNEKLKAEIIL